MLCCDMFAAAGDNVGTVLLENPTQSNRLTAEQLRQECQVIFGHRGKQVKLFSSPNMDQGKIFEDARNETF